MFKHTHLPNAGCFLAGSHKPKHHLWQRLNSEVARIQKTFKATLSNQGLSIFIWLVDWTPLKNISQLGCLFPIYGKIKNVPNHQPVIHIHHYSSIFWFADHPQFCNQADQATKIPRRSLSNVWRIVWAEIGGLTGAIGDLDVVVSAPRKVDKNWEVSWEKNVKKNAN